jgi:signal transduction histidine kinase
LDLKKKGKNRPKENRKLAEEIQKTLDVLSDSILDLEVEIKVEVSSDLVVKVIPAYLNSIILNMLTNAIKYRSPNRKCQILISAEKRKAGGVQVDFKDNGLGMDLEKVGKKLFGMYKTFHQVPDARGLGLFITKNQVEAMGGRIEVQSAVDEGTVFSVFLPSQTQTE